MAITGSIYSLAKKETDLTTKQIFENMISESRDTGVVVMDGRSLAAGSIFAEQIHADAITADHIESGAIETDHMDAGTIDVSVLKGSQLILPGANYGGVVINKDGLTMKSTGTAKLDIKLSSDSGFNITDGNDNQLIDIDPLTGNVKMQINEMTIGGHSAATTEDIEKRPTFEDFEKTDKVTIDGGNIKAGTLTASQITTGVLQDIKKNTRFDLTNGTFNVGDKFTYDGSILSVNADNINLSGKVSFNDFNLDLKNTVDSKVTQSDVDSSISNIEVGARNLIIKSNRLNNTTSSSVGLSKWGYLLSNDEKSFSVNLDENEQYTLSFLGHNEGLTSQNVKVAVNGAINDKKTIDVVSGSNKYSWVFTTDNFKSNEEETYPLQPLGDWDRYYKNSPAIVTNPNDIAYQKWSFDGAPLENMGQVTGGMFGGVFPINGHLNGGIDTPATAWAGVNISKMYLETNDDTLLPKIRAIGDFFLNHVVDIDIWSAPLKAMPNAVTFDEVSRQWIPSTRFIHTRTFYHVAWALLEIYDATKDTKYSNLAGQLLDSATTIQLTATSQANSNELPPYFSGAMFNTINNVGEASYEPDWLTFTNTNGDMVVRATNKWIKLFGNSTRASFELYAWEEKKYTVKSIADDYISHLLYLYNNQGLRKPDGHNLLYNFSHFEWTDEPHPDGYMVPVPMNWDFINEVFGKDQWFTGDLMFWAIIGFAEAGEAQIATSLLDRYYELKAPDPEGRLLFHDRYTAQGTPLVRDTSKSITFTGLYMQARNILGNHDYDAESLNSLEYYQKESALNTVDGGFSWDTEDYNSFIENKSLGEILFSVMENASKSEPLVTISFENFVSNPVYVLDIQLEKGNIATDWREAPEDVEASIGDVDKKAIDTKNKTDAWTYSGETTIDGGAIQADTITAAQISANSITADEINVDKISALASELGEVTAGTITSENGNIYIDLNDGFMNVADGMFKIQGKNIADTEDLGQLEEKIDKEIEDREGFISFNNGIVTIGQKDSPTNIQIKNDRISFMQNGTEVAYITEQTMEITHGIFVETAKVGEHKQETLTGGHTVFTWEG